MAKQIKNVPLENDSLQVVESKKAPKQVFTLENLNPALLPELASFKEKQLQVVKDNPFVKITDTASRELAKKHRTARVSARTALQSQDKLISSKFNEAKTKAKTYIAELIELTQPGELEQQKEIDRDEAVLEEKRNEKARLEKERIENIKAELDKYSDEWKDAFNLMTFQTMNNIGVNFVESYTTYDTAILEEFESLFPAKVEELTKILEDKTVLLTDKEKTESQKKIGEFYVAWGSKLNYMVFENSTETIKVFQELEKLTFFIPEFQEEYNSKFNEIQVQLFTKQRDLVTAKADADKLAEEKEKLEKEKTAFENEKKEEWKKVISNRKHHLTSLGFIEDKSGDYVFNSFTFLLDDIISLKAEAYSLILEDAMNYIEEVKLATSAETPSSELLHGNKMEDKAIELIQNVDSSVPENTTVNVCKPFEQAIKETAEAVPAPLAETPLTPKDCIAPPTWDSIAEDFKSSGEKSYSLWLKNNYNVPTKIQ
jgi:hypothetical protein